MIPVFSVTSDYAVSEWPLQPNDTMVDYYLSRAFATASDNDCPSVSLFYYGIPRLPFFFHHLRCIFTHTHNTHVQASGAMRRSSGWRSRGTGVWACRCDYSLLCSLSFCFCFCFCSCSLFPCSSGYPDHAGSRDETLSLFSLYSFFFFQRTPWCTYTLTHLNKTLLHSSQFGM